jgi:hypothetical protein
VDKALVIIPKVQACALLYLYLKFGGNPADSSKLHEHVPKEGDGSNGLSTISGTLGKKKHTSFHEDYVYFATLSYFKN